MHLPDLFLKFFRPFLVWQTKTMQHSPPPLFKQGASARVKVVFFTIFSIALLVVDSKMNSLVNVRQLAATIIYPIQRIAVAPRDALYSVSDYFSSNRRMQLELDHLKTEQITNAELLGRSTFLTTENAQLRRLFDMKTRTPTKSVLAEVVYEVHNFSSRKVLLNKGLKDGVALSQPVIDDRGVVGQVTRVFPLTSEITLLKDKSHAIPVQIARNGLRAVLHGKGQFSPMEMSMTTNADVMAGDVLVTSGLDGIYPEGLQVAKVMNVESKASTTFENVLCEPTAGIDQYHQLLILLVDVKNVGLPETEEVRTTKEKINRRVTREVTREASIEPAAPEKAQANNKTIATENAVKEKAAADVTIKSQTTDAKTSEAKATEIKAIEVKASEVKVPEVKTQNTLVLPKTNEVKK